MNQIVYITPEQARITHAKTIEYSGGGALEELDFERLESVLCNIQNDDWYPTFVDKLTHLFFSTCQFHCFADGNKRLAITLSSGLFFVNSLGILSKELGAILRSAVFDISSGCSLYAKSEYLYVPRLVITSDKLFSLNDITFSNIEFNSLKAVKSLIGL